MTKDLSVAYCAKLRTVLLMDEFEKRDSLGRVCYERLILENFCSVRTGQKQFRLDLVIDRSNYTDCDRQGAITFTVLKRKMALKCFEKSDACPVYPMIAQVIEQLQNCDDPSGEITFEDIYTLMAQNSFNRVHYGGFGCGRAREQHTLYGETTLYRISGVKYRFLSERGR